MKFLREYIRELLVEAEGSYTILIPNPPSIRFRIQELSTISHQYTNKYNPESLQRLLDSRHRDVFDFVLVKEGKGSHRPYIDQLNREVLPAIIFHKEYFNQLRPYELAREYGIDFEYDKLETIQNRSYPSGHTTQAFYIATKLSRIFPDLKKQLFTVAHMVAESRIDSGVHFPSDNEAGKLLAAKLSGEIK